METSSLSYTKWIEEYIKSKDGYVHGQCSDAAMKMNKDFPELRIVKGHVYDLQYGQGGGHYPDHQVIGWRSN